MPTAPAEGADHGGGRRQRLMRLAGSPLLRAAVTLLILAFVASRLDWSRIGARLRDGNPLDFALAVGVVMVALVVGACRWHALLRGIGVRLRASRLARIYAVSTFSNTFLPTSAGGDVTRALLVTRRGAELRRVVVTVLVDRAGGLAGLLALAWLALATAPARIPHSARTALIWTTLALVLAAFMTVIALLRGGRLGRRVLPDRVVSVLRDMRDVLLGYARSPALLASWLLLSVAYQTLIVAQLVILGRAIGVELPFPTAAVALTLVTLVTLIPISIGGFGIREGSYVVLLGSVSIAASDAALISVLSVATLLVASLPGAYLIVRGDVGASDPAIA